MQAGVDRLAVAPNSPAGHKAHGTLGVVLYWPGTQVAHGVVPPGEYLRKQSPKTG